MSKLKQEIFIERKVTRIHSPDYLESKRLFCRFLSVLALDYLIDSFGLYSHFMLSSLNIE